MTTALQRPLLWSCTMALTSIIGLGCCTPKPAQKPSSPAATASAEMAAEPQEARASTGAPDASQPALIPSQATLHQIITVKGRAQNAKQGALLKTDSGVVWVDQRAWPDALLGQALAVTGKVVARGDAPVFIARPGEPQRGGIPLPEGSDLAKAASRYLLTNIEYTRIAPKQP